MGDERKIIIAHRGASGYLPEHTLAAKALAYGMEADFIEQDVVLTKDDHPVVLHDIHVDTVTDVAKAFPDRARQDGRFYAIDFTLAELKTLHVHERINLKTRSAAYPKRFPVGNSHFTIPTLAEEIELIQGLNRSTGRDVGIYPEIKAPRFHQAEGKDISKIVLEVLNDYGYRTRDDNIFLQCFDAQECRRIRQDLKCQLKLVQLIGENDWGDATTDHDRLRTAAGLDEISRYADGIGPRMQHVVTGQDGSRQIIVTPLVAEAHQRNLQVHPYTLRLDELPEYTESFEQLVDVLFNQANVDGFFTDFPDLARRARDGK